MDFDTAFAYVVNIEAGYINNPKDPGGETNLGISKRAFPKEDIPNMTIPRAKYLYKTYYWDKLKCDYLPQSINLHIFDFGVNAGVPQCVKTMQGLLGIKKDAILGAITLRNAQKITPWSFAKARSKHYTGIVKSKASQIVFLDGWLNRTFDVTQLCIENK